MQKERSPERDKKQHSLTPTLDEVRSFAEAGHNIIPVYQTLPGDLETPGRIYLKLAPKEAQKGRPTFLFESVEVGEKLGKYSYIGLHPKHVFAVSDERVDPLEILERKILGKQSVAPVPGLPPFSGGFVGYLGYECISRWEPTVPVHPDTLGIPDATFFEVGDLVIYDHIRQQIKVLTNIAVDGRNVEKEYEKAQKRIEHIVARLHKTLDPTLEYPQGTRPVKDNQVASNFTQEEYMQVVREAKEYILDGDIFQVVPSQRLSKKTNVDPYSIYRHYRSTNPSPYMFFIDFGRFQLIGTSPEVAVGIRGNRITSRPLAGTRPRGFETSEDGIVDFESIDPVEDQRLEEELKGNPKEQAEHIMLVDLARNDVGRVAVPGSVTVTSLMDVERFSRVMHLSSTVEGELASDRTSFDAIRATFPVGTVSGAPKVEAMKKIYEFEPTRRGPYSGAVGSVGYSGDVQMAIGIRTLVYVDGVVHLQAGGGIVADSDPEEEFQETMRKASAGLKAVELAEQEEF